MPKVTQAMTDFSGGISTGTSPKNIDDNQLVEAENFIPMGKGSLVQVMDEALLCTSGLNAEMPKGRFSNIFAFQSDRKVTEDIQASQSNNNETFSSTIVQAGTKFRFTIYVSSWKHPGGTTAIQIFNLTILDLDAENESIFHFSDSVPRVKDNVETEIMLADFADHNDVAKNAVKTRILDALNAQGASANPPYSATTRTVALTSTVLDISTNEEKNAGIVETDSGPPPEALYNAYTFETNDVDILDLTNSQWVLLDGHATDAFTTKNTSNGDVGILKNGTSKAVHVYLPFTTVIGSYYVVECKVWAGYDKIQVSLSSTTAWDDSHQDTATASGDTIGERIGAHGGYFLADSTTSYLHLRSSDSTTDAEIQIDYLRISDGGDFITGEFIEVTFDYFGERNLNVYPSESGYNLFNKAIDMSNKFSGYPDAFIDSALGVSDGDKEIGIWSRTSWGYTGTPIDGAFEIVKINLPNPSLWEVGTYSFTLKIYKDVTQATHTSYTISYSVNLTDTLTTILNGLKQITDDSQTEPDNIVFVDVESDGLTLYQDVDTPKAYSFEVTSIDRSVTAEVPLNADNNTIAVGQKSSKISLYSLEGDEWLDYVIDLTKAGETAPNCQFSFFSADGFMRVCDPFFNAYNKPKWFGYLDLSKTYGQQTLLSEPVGWFSESVSPIPDTSLSTHLLVSTGITWAFVNVGSTLTLTDSSYQVDISHGLRLYYDEIGGDSFPGAWVQNDIIEFYFTYLYEGGAMSPLVSMGSFIVANASKSYGFQIKIGKAMFGYTDNYNINNRLKGIEIYCRAKSSDSLNYWLFSEIDFMKGWRTFGISGWNAFVKEQDYNYRSQTADTGIALSDAFVYQSPPKFQTYKDRYSGIDPENASTGFDIERTGWKTATVYNRRAYYGNVRIKDEAGNIKYFPDGIIKTPKNMFDVVSISNLVEAVINDGDEIFALRVAGDKLCQFKKNSLVIMEIKLLDDGQQFEQIHRIIPHVGVMTDSAICNTPMGLFWVSKSGAYIYNGEKLEKLTESQSGDIISKQEWGDNITDRAHVGYDSYWNQIHICGNTQNNSSAYIYDLGTGAWSKTFGIFGDSYKSGFVNDREGHICWAEEYESDNTVNPQDDPSAAILPSINNDPNNMNVPE